MKYLLAVLILALTSSCAWASSAPRNDNFANASVVAFTPSSIATGALVKGSTYIITSLGTTNFTAVGADANLVGIVFVATGPTTGTGTVSSVATYSGANITNIGSTSETGEPIHATVGAGNSVWWVWKPTTPGTATIDTNGSSFDTVLAVYTGASVSTLTKVAYDDDVSPTNITSKVSFTVQVGATYYIAVDGFKGGAKGAAGAITLHLAIGPGTSIAQNDDFADRALIAGEYAVVKGDSQLASLESGENAIVNSYTYSVNSVWWTWTAPRAGTVTITSSMLMNGGDGWLNFYGLVEVFSANSNLLSGLTFLSSDEGASGTTDTPSIPTLIRTVRAGEVLHIRVADFYTTNGAQITLTVSMDSADLANDHFAKRSLLVGSSASAFVSNNFATAQKGEPGHYEEVTAGNFITGQTYMINSLGNTNFTSVGAGANTLGAEFTATGSGTGTGTALHLRPMVVQSNFTIYTVDKIVAGKTYVINTLGNTNFKSIGATAFTPYVGEEFVATAAGTGTGTVYLLDGLLTVGQTYRIESLGGTDFTLLGAAQSTVGTTFTASATGFGGGTVLPVDVISAGSFVIGRNYRIESTGSTSFMAIGASSNAVGTTFQATGVGSGTGTASTPTASKSVWWSWVAPSNGYVSISTSGSLVDNISLAKLDTLLKVYTSANLSNISLSDIIPLASNDDASVSDPTSFMHFKVVQGTSYQIAVDSGDSARDTGDVILGLLFTPDVPVITTQVENATAYVGSTPAVFTVSNSGAAAVYDWQVKVAGSNTWVHYSDGVTTSPALANGVATSTLTIPVVTQAMNGDQYRCVISNIAGQVTSRTVTLTAVYLITYQGGSPTASNLGVVYSVPPLATDVLYYASGLPAGLKLDSATGVISGQITSPSNRSYTVKYWTTYVLNGVKTKSVINNAVTLVNPFPATATGGFEGLFIKGGVPCGKVSLLVNTPGSFTGKFMYNGAVYALHGALALDTPTSPTKGTITLPVGSLSLVIDVKTNSTMKATLKNGLVVVGDTGGDGVRLKTYDRTIPAPWAGSYTLALNQPTYIFPDTGPKGSGYGFASIDFNGMLHLSGKLADGTIVTALLSTDGTTDGQYRPYVSVYSNKYGFLAGWMPLSLNAGSGRYHISTVASQDFYWVKNVIPNDKGSYPAGFGPVGLNVVMEPWIAPTNFYLIGSLGLLTPSNSQTTGNFGLKLTQAGGVDNTGGNPEALPTSLKMDALSRVSVLNPSNPRNFTCKITTLTGYYKGSFTMSDGRKANFEGVLLQNSAPVSGDVFGYGYFLVPPALPSSGTLQSGDVQFTIP